MKPARTNNDNRQRVLQVAREIIGHKGFSAVGLNDILNAAGIPKGSFYYYFASKEEFGVAMLQDYFASYLQEMDALLASDQDAARALLGYWQNWLVIDEGGQPKGYQCLAVKLGAEVSDLSQAMRAVLDQGTAEVIRRLAQHLEIMVQQTGFTPPPEGITEFASSLYQLWLGASLLGKINGQLQPLNTALALTKRLLPLY